MCKEAPVSPAQVDREALPMISLERRHVSNSSSSESEVLVNVSSFDSDLASSAPYALPVLLLDFLGSIGGSVRFKEDGFGGDSFFFLRFFSALYVRVQAVRESCYTYADVYCSAVAATFCMVPGRVYLHDVSMIVIGVEGAHQEEEDHLTTTWHV
jgi:hypothetical protein